MSSPVIKMNQSQHKSRVDVRTRPDPTPFRHIGLGMSPDPQKIAEGMSQGKPGLGAAGLMDWVKDSVACPISSTCPPSSRCAGA